jgi:hypothetical protein
MRWSVRVCTVLLSVAIGFLAFRFAAADQYGKLKIDDMVVVIFGFEYSRDGTIKNIRVVRCENPEDRSEAKHALSPQEEAWGVRIVESEAPKPRRGDLGKTRYTYLIFDKRVRKYMKT